ncbi:oxidoreductase [Hymenobacter weizhouensis]|uniref:oxidoreductase n=1 Tax=Hymenobacter sp. YIM 151500-1 TaxID=2987689 RepID=UPI0022267726|nr:oxidoreductase [Hymenobacter sp. YIM 151500-1]UYZ64092.1 oxidoreductase [Hymenobacter sp. YIM 151500-1]
MSKTYFITGTSSGFGRALAEAVLADGHQAVLAARKADSVADLTQRYPDTALFVALDVTDASAREAAVRAAVERFGRVDVLANIAGQGSLGAAEEFSSEQLRQQMEVNFWGAAELTRAFLPTFRRQKSGHILNLTSIGGLAGVGGFSAYCASKFALEDFSEALHDEVKPLGIHVTIVEPGAFRTEFAGDKNMRPAQTIEEYQPVIEPIRQYLYGGAGQQPGDPHKAALAMMAAVESAGPPLRLMLGADAYGLWEKKRAALDQELAQWRSVGENTAFEGVTVAPVGG